jgi:hypothetical protein
MGTALLLTSGCSFSQVPSNAVTWPVHLQEILKCNAQHHGKAASGNGIISRSIIFHVSEALKKYKPEEILVGIMWSGADRHEFYSTDTTVDTNRFGDGISVESENPVRITSNNRNFYLLNNHWDNVSTKTYFKYFYDDIGSKIYTIEHILRTQWFLKLTGINYFMMTYGADAMPSKDEQLHPDIKPLYDMVDFANFVDAPPMSTWTKKSKDPSSDGHPNTMQHKVFTQIFIIPHLKKKMLIE